jgi:hypothetical protein
LVFEPLAQIVDAEGYLYCAEMLPDIFSLLWIMCAIGVIVYFHTISDATIQDAFEHIKVFLYHEWLAASEFYVAYLIQHAIYLIPKSTIVSGPSTLLQHDLVKVGLTGGTVSDLFYSELAAGPTATDPAFEIADIA